MSEWKEVLIESICEVTSSKRIFYNEYVSNGIPFFRSKEIIELSNKQDVSTDLFISKEKFTNIKAKYGAPLKDDILLTSVGTLGIPYIVPGTFEFYFKDGNLTWFKKWNNQINPIFFYWWLRSPQGYQSLLDISIGSTQPALTISGLKGIKLLLPPLHEQEAIAEILSSLDDKIDLLQRQNKTLEEMAETLFRQWFVEEADDSWEASLLSKLVNIKYGKDHKNLNDGNIPAYGSGGIMRMVDKSLYDKESVLIPRKGTLSNIIYINKPFWTVDTMFYTDMKHRNIAKFIYHFLKEQDLASMNVGSAVPSMTTDILNNLPISIPPDCVLEIFENQISFFYDKMDKNINQIQKLSTLRDKILPKLMNSELKVKIN